MRTPRSWTARVASCVAAVAMLLVAPGTLFAEPLNTDMAMDFDAVRLCTTSLQSLVDAAAPGATLQLPACIFRETVTITRPLTLVGVAGTEVRGSDVWTGWKRSGAYWTRGPLLQLGNQAGVCQSGTACQSVYQVFVDGAPLVHVASRPSTGQFAIDKNRNVVLGSDPSGHQVEVTTRAAWLIVRSDNVTIDGITMQHAANDAQTGALLSNGVSNLVVRNATLAYAHGVNVQFIGGNGHQLLNSDIHHAGQLGASAYQASQVLVQGNRIHDNNTAGFDPNWEAGGAKFSTSSNVVFDSNEVYANTGQGLWCDIACQNTTYRQNRVHDNTHMGIVFEISNGATITGNAVWNNASAVAEGWGCDIYISSSSNVDVSYNTVLATSTHGVLVVSENRTDAPAARSVVNVSVHDNTIVMDHMLGTVGRTALGWLQNWQGTLFNSESNNHGYNNAFWFSYPESSWQRFAWGSQSGGQGTLADFSATAGGTSSRYLSVDQRDQALMGASMPAVG